MKEIQILQATSRYLLLQDQVVMLPVCMYMYFLYVCILRARVVL